MRAAPRARLGKISSGQPSPGPFQPNLGMSPGVPQFDPEFQSHLSLRFSACRFHPNQFPVKTETFLRAAPRARLGKISSGQPSLGPFQPNLGMSPGYPSLTQNFKPIFSYIFKHADSTQIDSRSKRKLFCAPRRARAWAKSVLASPAQGHSSQIWVCHRGYPSLTQNFKPIFSYIFKHADSTQIDSRSKRKLFCAPRRARAWAKSVLASPA